MELKNTIVIVADLGELKAFKAEKHQGIVGNEIKISYALELMNDENFISGRKKLSDVVTDSAGRMGEGGPENHNLKTERENRTLKEIAQEIEVIVKGSAPKQIFLAFPKEHNHELINALSHGTKALITKNVAADLVKTDKEKLLSHFK